MSPLPALPDSWAWAPLEDLAAVEPRAITDGPFGSNLKTAHYTEEGPRVIRLQNIGDGSFIDEKAHISEERFDALRAHEARPGDIVVASLGDRLPRACLVPEWLGPAIVKADCPRIRLHPAIDARYITLALNSRTVRRQAAEHVHGVGRPRMKLAALRTLLVPLPPADQQTLIANRAYDLLSAVERGQAHLAKAAAYTDGYQAASLGEMLGAGDAPRVRVDEVGEVFLGATPSRKNPSLWDGQVPWVSSGEVAFCRIMRTRESITEAALGNRSRRLQPPGTVLLAMYGEGKTRGQAAILDIHAAHNQAVAAIRTRPDRMIPEFLYFCLMQQYGEIRSVGHGGQQINLNGDLVRAIQVPCPSIELQRQIVGHVEAELRRLAAFKDVLEHGRARAGDLRESVIDSAVTGCIVVASSEAPANELLKTIREERSQARKPKSWRAVLVGG